MFNLKYAFLCMMFLVIASNCLVLYPLNDWLSWAAFTYPVTYLVTELTNRFHGPQKARQVVCLGFVFAVIFSVWLATPKVAFASGSAFLISQLLDISIFNKFRYSLWWVAPLFASISASVIDASIFWSLAFWGEDLPILSLAIGDTSVKILIDVAMLTPFRLGLRKLA